MKKYLLVSALLALAGCMTSESALRDAFKKNPKLVFDVIEENPEQFMESVNRATSSLKRRQMESSRARAQGAKPALDPARRLVGDDQSPIVVVEYADYQCPACRYAFESLSGFKKKYPGKVQFYYKHMPLSFHKAAMPAARYHEAIRMQGADKAMKFYDYVFARQDKLGSKDFLDTAAKEAGADLKRLKKDLESEQVSANIQADMVEFERFGFTGTPSILVNGTPFLGAPSMEELERAVSNIR